MVRGGPQRAVKTATTASGDPVVDGTYTGQIVIDGDATTGSSPVHLHLHILKADFTTIIGDAVAMLREILPGAVSSLNGNGTWTAAHFCKMRFTWVRTSRGQRDGALFQWPVTRPKRVTALLRSNTCDRTDECGSTHRFER
jgi:hypothetical protein